MATPAATGAAAIDALVQKVRVCMAPLERERMERSKEISELEATLCQLEAKLRSEDRMANDLERRVDVVESVLLAERLRYSKMLFPELNLLSTSEGSSQDASSQQPQLKPWGLPQHCMPPARTRCKDLLKRYLKEAQLDDFKFPSTSKDDELYQQYFGGLRTKGSINPPGKTGENVKSEQADSIRMSSTRSAVQSGSAGAGAQTRDALESQDRQLTDATAAQSRGAIDSVKKSCFVDAEVEPLPDWRLSFRLRSHLDGARCVVCDEVGGVLISCGEDTLIQGWDISVLRDGKQSVDDSEVFVTLRGHKTAVLSLAYHPSHRLLFSGGMDSTIRAWHFPEPRVHDAYGTNASFPSLRAGLFTGHRDAVWSLQLHPSHMHLASGSADGTVAIWNVDPQDLAVRADPWVSSLKPPSHGKPDAAVTSVSWIPANVTSVLAGYTSAQCMIYDVRNGNRTLVLEPKEASTCSEEGRSVTAIACHAVMPLAMAAYEDNCVRIFDVNSGRQTDVYSEHNDVVTSVSIDPARPHSFATSSHDGCVRCFDLRTGKCLQQLRLHDSKYDEAIHCVHHSGSMLSTSGTDGCISVLSAD